MREGLLLVAAILKAYCLSLLRSSVKKLRLVEVFLYPQTIRSGSDSLQKLGLKKSTNLSAYFEHLMIIAYSVELNFPSGDECIYLLIWN